MGECLDAICFAFPGKVAGKGRPRFSSRGGKIRTFTPAKTRAAETFVKTFGRQAFAGRAPFNGPVSLSVCMMVAIPKSWSRAKRENAYWVTAKPDIDNTLKLLADSLNGIAWVDDSQIADVHVTRVYSPTATIDRTMVSIESLRNRPRHAPNCDYHVDQYEFECTCGLRRKAA